MTEQETADDPAEVVPDPTEVARLLRVILEALAPDSDADARLRDRLEAAALALEQWPATK